MAPTNLFPPPVFREGAFTSNDAAAWRIGGQHAGAEPEVGT